MPTFLIKERRVSFIECEIEADNRTAAELLYMNGDEGLDYDEEVTASEILSVTQVKEA